MQFLKRNWFKFLFQTPIEQCISLDEFKEKKGVVFSGLNNGHYSVDIRSVTLAGTSESAILEKLFKVYVPGWLTWDKALYITAGILLVLIAIGLILYRWHNIQAQRMQELHPDWTDEELFQAARRFVIATLQKIILYDFVPALLNDPNAISKYEKYKPYMPPGISHSFATTAFRFPHSIVPPALFLRQKGCAFRTEVAGFPALRLCQNWWNAQDIVQEYTVDEIILGMASQIAEDEDHIVVEDLRDFIFGPMHFTRLDVVSTSIMRARDNGIPPYNVLRKVFGLAPKTFETINPTFTRNFPDVRFQDQFLILFISIINLQKISNLSALYNNNIDILDAYVGGMLESNGDGPGELFSELIKDQFTRIRDSDRFWFENRLNGQVLNQ